MNRAIIFAALFLTSCDARSVKQTADLSKLSYQIDGRTGECYAVIGHGRGFLGPSEGFTITWVPCTPRVLAAVAEDSR